MGVLWASVTSVSPVQLRMVATPVSRQRTTTCLAVGPSLVHGFAPVVPVTGMRPSGRPRVAGESTIPLWKIVLPPYMVLCCSTRRARLSPGRARSSCVSLCVRHPPRSGNRARRPRQVFRPCTPVTRERNRWCCSCSTCSLIEDGKVTACSAMRRFQEKPFHP